MTQAGNERDDRRVVVYSAAERKYCEALIAGYVARHPGDEVEFHDGISVALDRRFRDEIAAGAPTADVMWSSAMDLQIALVREGYAAACAPRNAASLPAAAIYRGCAFATTVEPLVTLVASAEVGDVPAGSLAEIAELLRSDVLRFRGRVVAYDITRNGLGFLAMLHERRLRPGFDRYLDVLRQVGPRLHPWNPPLVDELAGGRAALAAHVLGSYAQRAVDTHPALSTGRSAYPAVGVSRIAFVSAHARHPRAAARFVDYLLSDEGQALLGRAGLFPIRRTPHADREHAMRATAAIPLDESFDELLDRAARDDLLQQWRSAVGSPLPA